MALLKSTPAAGSDVHGSTLGVIGLWWIGQAVARRALGFGMTVLYQQRNRATDDVETALGATILGLRDLLCRSDIVSIHVRLHDSSTGL